MRLTVKSRNFPENFIANNNLTSLLLGRSEEWNLINEEEKIRLQHKVVEDGEFW